MNKAVFIPSAEANGFSTDLNIFINHPILIPLKRVKKANPEAYAYAVKADRLLTDYFHN